MGSRGSKVHLGEMEIMALAASVGKEPEEIEDMFRKFIKAYPKGKIKKRDLKEVMSLATAIPYQKRRRIRNHIFRIYDKNNDGFIDFSEFVTVHHIMAGGSTQEILEGMFRIFDINNDGIISKKELRELVKDMFDLILNDCEEYLDEDETHNCLDLIVNGVFTEMDKNQNGKITLEDFISACKNRHYFTEVLIMAIIGIFINSTVAGGNISQNNESQTMVVESNDNVPQSSNPVLNVDDNISQDVSPSSSGKFYPKLRFPLRLEHVLNFICISSNVDDDAVPIYSSFHE